MGLNHASVWTMLATTLRCRSVAPFDTPVVPPVYCRKATSSAAIGDTLELHTRAFCQCLVEASDAAPLSGGIELRDHLAQCRTTKLTSCPLQRAQHVAHRGQYDVPDLVFSRTS